MKFINLHKSVAKLINSLSNGERQGEYYDSQKANIIELKAHPGFRYIIEYFEFEAENAMMSLSDVKTPKELIPYHQAQYKLSTGFIDFIDRMQ